MMDLLQGLLNDRGSELVNPLVEQAGFSPGEARSFLPAALEQVSQAIGGGFDLKSLLGGGGVSELLARVDTGAVAREAGVPEAKAESGLQAMLPKLLGLLQDKAGGAEGLLSMLGGAGGSGGAGGALGKLAGKLFNR